MDYAFENVRDFRDKIAELHGFSCFEGLVQRSKILFAFTDSQKFVGNNDEKIAIYEIIAIAERLDADKFTFHDDYPDTHLLWTTDTFDLEGHTQYCPLTVVSGRAEFMKKSIIDWIQDRESCEHPNILAVFGFEE